MGVVYLAERNDGQYRRRVAVKLLRAGADADELRRRFVAERQILASLSHPNIAQLLDGGVAEGELPYLVIEYVDGVPITTYCERHGLDVEARLRLFQSVCAAVHHAHQNLVPASRSEARQRARDGFGRSEAPRLWHREVA
jgi:serine/threonine-protein kinase